MGLDSASRTLLIGPLLCQAGLRIEYVIVAAFLPSKKFETPSAKFEGRWGPECRFQTRCFLCRFQGSVSRKAEHTKHPICSSASCGHAGSHHAPGDSFLFVLSLLMHATIPAVTSEQAATPVHLG